MKTKIRLLLLISFSVLFFTYCDTSNNEEPSNDNFIISGTVINFNAKEFDVLKFKDGMNDDYIICSTKVNSDGKFKITLPIPTTKRIIDTSFFPEDMPISDSEARIGGGENSNPIAFKNNIKVGHVYKSSINPIASTNSIGTTTEFLYFDRSINIEWTDYSRKKTEIYNLTIKSGWNEIAKIEDTSSITFTTTIPAGLKWYYIPE